MNSRKVIKEYYCVYCNKQFNDNKWTYDHIIPMNIGGPDKLKIICCNDCNQKLGVIEQKCCDTFIIRNIMIGLHWEEKIRVKTRRKKNKIVVFKKLGFWKDEMDEILLRSNYDFNKGETQVEAYGKNKQKFFDYKGQKTMIFIPDKFTEQDEIILSKLVYKILIGACCFVYDKEFFGTTYHNYLRENLWNLKEPLRHSHSKAFIMTTGNGELKEETEEEIIKRGVFFDNKPTHTIFLGGSDGSFGGIISLFGELNYAVTISNTKESKDFEPKFLIAKTTENNFSLLSSHEYEDMYKQK